MAGNKAEQFANGAGVAYGKAFKHFREQEGIGAEAEQGKPVGRVGRKECVMNESAVFCIQFKGPH